MVVSRRRVQSHKPVRYVLNTLRIQIVYYLYTGCNKNIRPYYRFFVRNVHGQSNVCSKNFYTHEKILLLFNERYMHIPITKPTRDNILLIRIKTP